MKKTFLFVIYVSVLWEGKTLQRRVKIKIQLLVTTFRNLILKLQSSAYNSLAGCPFGSLGLKQPQHFRGSPSVSFPAARKDVVYETLSDNASQIVPSGARNSFIHSSVSQSTNVN